MIKHCEGCAVEFETTGQNQKFCSVKCRSKVTWKRHYDLHKDKMKIKRDRENAYVEQRMFYRVKSRAKAQGTEFNIELSDIFIPAVCPVLGIELVSNHGRQGYFPSSPSLDRIDPNKGYVKGNVRVISARANLLKNDAELWELEAVLKDAKSLA